jgi:hypothetical protein
MIHKLVSGTFELSPCSFFKQRLPITSSLNGTGTYFTLLLTRCCSRSTLESSLGIYPIFTFLQQRVPLTEIRYYPFVITASVLWVLLSL